MTPSPIIFTPPLLLSLQWGVSSSFLSIYAVAQKNNSSVKVREMTQSLPNKESFKPNPCIEAFNNSSGVRGNHHKIGLGSIVTTGWYYLLVLGVVLLVSVTMVMMCSPGPVMTVVVVVMVVLFFNFLWFLIQFVPQTKQTRYK